MRAWSCGNKKKPKIPFTMFFPNHPKTWSLIPPVHLYRKRKRIVVGRFVVEMATSMFVEDLIIWKCFLGKVEVLNRTTKNCVTSTQSNMCRRVVVVAVRIVMIVPWDRRVVVVEVRGVKVKT